MKRTKTTIFMIMILAFTAVPITLFSFATAEPAFVLPDYEPMDIGVSIRNQKLEKLERSAPSIESASSDPKTSQNGGYHIVGDIVTWLSYDTYQSGWYTYAPTDFRLRAIGSNVEIWVQEEPDFPDGDTRNPVVVTDDQVNYLLDEFETEIYPSTTDYFGIPDFWDGSLNLMDILDINYYGSSLGLDYLDYIEPTGRNVILVSNFIDDNYWDPDYPSYIAGFYSGNLEYICDRNIISIDTYDWDNRVGDSARRANLYESVIAHEYQHLIHDDYAYSDSWMNEACSLFAEPLCGYEIDPGQIEWFLATPDNSLTEWGDQGGINILADYGSSMLWALYLTSHYGFEFLGDYVQIGGNNIDGLNYLLGPFGVDFMDVFHNWRVANLVNAECGPYSYSVFDFDLGDLDPIKVQEVEGKTVPWTNAGEEFGETYTLPYGDPEDPEDLPEAIDGAPTGYFDIAPFGSEYIQFPDLRGLYKFGFDGDDIAPFGWSYDTDDDWWYSGAADLYDALLLSEPISVNDGDLLTINTYWDIEDNLPQSPEGWDFGFIQVSDDDGETWTSLEDEDGWTTFDAIADAHPDILDSLPGITGWSGGFVNLRFDLSAYAGSDVLIRFRYITDWYTSFFGWVITEASVEGTDLILAPDYPEADFMVSLVSKYKIFGHTFYSVKDMNLNDLTEEGLTFMLDTKWKEVTVIVTPIHRAGKVDYNFKVSRLFGRHRRW